MEQPTYWKVPYVWEEPQAGLEVPPRLVFKSVEKAGTAPLLAMVASVMESSLDTSDRKKVVENGATKAAEKFLAEAEEYFSYQDAWWQIGFDHDGEPVGFVLPVIYPGATRDGLEEATLYYIGVLPKYRQQGFNSSPNIRQMLF